MIQSGGPSAPAESQMGRDAASSHLTLLQSCLAIAMFFCSLIPRPTAMIISWVRSTACLASLKTSCGLLRTTSRSPRYRFNRAACSRFDFVSAEGSILEGCEPWSISVKLTSAASLPWNIWRVNRSLSPSFL